MQCKLYTPRPSGLACIEIRHRHFGSSRHRGTGTVPNLASVERRSNQFVVDDGISLPYHVCIPLVSFFSFRFQSFYESTPISIFQYCCGPRMFSNFGMRYGESAMYLAFGYVANQKHVEPYFYDQLQQASRGARVDPDERLKRLHRGIQLPLGWVGNCTIPALPSP